MIDRFKRRRDLTKSVISGADSSIRDALKCANLTKIESYKLNLARTLILEVHGEFNQETREWIDRDTGGDK